ncbi:hypothetical protein [Streptomyces sp. NPDC127092]|uniref:hypothetical protein n=1 Tax=Streptomyces sp. NPDC127092 TaxID=3347135 RepID=UPI003662AFD7
MIRRLARTGAVLATASLFLTACSGGADDARPKAAPTRHPVFDQKLDRQVFLALRQTQKARTVGFTQRLTLTTKKGKAVQSVEGRLDFAKNTGDAVVRWTVPEKFSDGAKDAILGRVPGKSNADSWGRVLVDGQNITYRAASADYWLRYGAGDYDRSLRTLDRLRGTEAPVGGTLLEVLGGAEATSRQGVNYRATAPLDPVSNMLPVEISEQLTSETYTPGIARNKTVPLTVSLDTTGRLSRVQADLSGMLGKKGSVFPDATALTMELSLDKYGAPRPATEPTGRVLDAGKTVRSIHDVRPGRCVDFSTGQRDLELVAEVPCAKPHDGRLFAHASYSGGAYPDEPGAKKEASRACDRAYGRASDSWISEAGDEGAFWYMWGPDGISCYVVTSRGEA